MSETPIFDQLANEHLSRSRPLIDAIVAVGAADIIANAVALLDVEAIWAAGDVQ
jgi:hypothetical protein